MLYFIGMNESCILVVSNNSFLHFTPITIQIKVQHRIVIILNGWNYIPDTIVACFNLQAGRFCPNTVILANAKKLIASVILLNPNYIPLCITRIVMLEKVVFCPH